MELVEAEVVEACTLEDWHRGVAIFAVGNAAAEADAVDSNAQGEGNLRRDCASVIAAARVDDNGCSPAGVEDADTSVEASVACAAGLGRRACGS